MTPWSTRWYESAAELVTQYKVLMGESKANNIPGTLYMHNSIQFLQMTPKPNQK